MTLLRWFLSDARRHACELRKHVRREARAQSDLLTERARTELRTGLAAFDEQLRAARDKAAEQAAIQQLEEVATKWLQSYPSAGPRENVKEFLVSGVLIMTIFTFFVQPMKIPSGSAQPTLYGNVTTDLHGAPPDAIAHGKQRFLDWFRGIDYHEWVAANDGVLHIEAPSTSFGFIKEQRFTLGDDSYVIRWPPEDLLKRVRGSQRLYCGVYEGQPFHKGDVVLRLKLTSGDRLFIDRLTYRFRRPQRGDTIVFTSTDIPLLTQHTHYIKRLVGLGGEKIQLGDDRHLRINGERLDAAVPGFENVYSFQGPPRDSVYSGHVNEVVAQQAGQPGLAPNFRDEHQVFTVRKDHFLAFGDNTMNSYDGRGWGDFPREKVVGRALFVFWPFTDRFGPVYR